MDRLRRLDALGPKFAERFVVSDDGCWLWVAGKDNNGYGQFWVKPRTRRAHQLAYEAVHGPVPNGLELDHICRKPACINPDHLRAVTHYENVMCGFGVGARAARQERCKHGHDLTPENLVKTSGTRRMCLLCHRRRALAYYHRQRAASQVR